MSDRSGKLFRLRLCMRFCIVMMINSSLWPQGSAAGEWQWIVKPVFEHAESLNEGMAAVMSDGKYGYINSRGEIVIKPEYDEAGDFYNGIAPVIKNSLKTYINNKGFPVIVFKEDESRYFGEEYVVVKINGRYGYLMSSGKPALKPVYEDALSFNEGVAAVKIGGKYGFINKRGKIIIKPVYDKASVFSEGLAAVKVKGAWGYINKRGVLIIKPSFSEAGDFSSGLAHVRKESGFGYINNRGKFIIDPQFESAAPFSENMAAVEYGGKWGYIKIPELRKQGLKKTLRDEKILSKSQKIKDLLPDKTGDKKGKEVKAKEILKQRGSDALLDKKKGYSYTAELNVKEESTGNYRNIPQIKGMEYAGMVSEVNSGQVIITDSKTGEKVYLGAWCIIGVEDDRVYLGAGTPFSTVAKCDLKNGFYEKIKPGMKVYKKNK